MADTLTALDATFLELEQLEGGALMSIGGTMVFDPIPDGGVPTVAAVRRELAGRLSMLPRYTQRLSREHAGRFAWPHWEPDEHFDIANHVWHAALPYPGADGQLCDFTAEFFSHPLDRARPLWETVLLEGLSGGRWALVQKTHHCLVDGVGSVDVVQLLLDHEATPQAAPPEPRVPAVPSARDGDPQPPEALGQAAHAGLQTANAALHAARHPQDTFVRARSLGELLLREGLAPAPRTSLNVRIGQLRRFAVVRVPLGELKAIGHQMGASVNDVALAACTTGLRNLLSERGDHLPARGIRAMVPVNVRDGTGTLALGNRVSSLFVDLPVSEPGPLARLRQIAASTKRLKASRADHGATALLDIEALTPPLIVHAALAQTGFSTRMFNITITNVPGPQRPLYAFGALMRELHPVVPLAAEHAVGIAIFSYNGSVCFGINADSESTPDIAELAYGVERGVEELLELLPEGP